MTRRSYSDEQKAQALALYEEHGPAEAARRTGVAEGTISQWARRTGLVTLTAQKRAVGAQVAREAWAKRRLEEADAAGADAGEVRDEIMRLVHERPRDARELATVYGVLVDKAQLLSGGPTSRNEDGSRAEKEAKLAQMLSIVINEG